jgi:tripartite ATP-independent transporter DctM subunit
MSGVMPGDETMPRAGHHDPLGPFAHPVLHKAEHLFGYLIDLPAAALVVAEVVMIFLGVVSRFVFDHPLEWTDELITTGFLWLTMFGAAGALRRAEHMRMTTLVGMAPGPWQMRLNALGIAAPAVFLVLLTGPAYQYALGQWSVTTPVLGLPDSYRAAAMPVGCLLMILACLFRITRFGWRDIAFALAVMAVVAAVLAAAAPALTAMGNGNLLVFFVALLAAGVLAGVPIAFSFGLCTLAYLLDTGAAPLSVVAGEMDQGMSAVILLAIPLFILLGYLIVATRMAAVIVEFLAAALGHVRGGLSYVLLGAVLLVSGISGAKTADLAAVAPVLVPEMKRRGIPQGEILALLATSGAMAETIPPSIVLIIIGSVTGVSISALFTGGLLPGIVLAGALALVARYRTAPRIAGIVKASRPEMLRRFVIAIPALLLPFVIRFAVIEGVATATEVSTIGVVYTILVGLLVYRHFEWHRLYAMLVQTASLAGAILFIIGAATAMGWALTQSNFSQGVAVFLAGVPGGKLGFLAASIAVMTVLGSVLEGIPAMVLFGPLLFPIARVLGINDVHYAVVVILSMGIGLFAPPFGLGYYAASTIARINPDEALGRIWPYLGALMAGLILVALVPWISTGFLGPH